MSTQLNEKNARIAGARTGVFILIIVFVVIGGALALRKQTPPPSETPQNPPARQITVAQFGDLLLYLPLYIAVDEGLFSKRGVDVRVVSTGGDDKTYAAVIAGSAEFGLADPTFVAIAREQNQMGKVVALLINGMPNYGVASRNDVPTIKKPEDLKGHTVATVPAPSTSYALMKKLFEAAGLQPAIRQVAPSALVPTLEAREADYAVLIEPWASAVVQNGGHVAFSLNEYYRDFALTGLTTASTMIQNNPTVVKDVVAALTEGVAIFYEKPDRALAVARKRFANENPEALREGITRMRNEKIYPRVLSTMDKAWDVAIQLRRDGGDLANPPLPIAEYVDNSFANEAAKSN